MLLSMLPGRMDSLNLFPCISGGPSPFILLDGHGSCLQVPLLCYLNNTNHRWFFYIGLTNSTAYWQVGDSPEQTGSWKMAMTKDKKELVIFKTRMGMDITIKTTGIVPITCQAWDKSFVSYFYIKRATATRG